MAHRHCNSFTRSSLIRDAAAQAGQGLPAVERGMPLPAGTGLSRRSLLMRGAGLALAVYGGPRLLDLDVLQAGVAHAAGPSNPVIVSVFLDGGIDSMSLLAPIGDPLYRKLRPKLALREDRLTKFDGDDRLAWHPARPAWRRCTRRASSRSCRPSATRVPTSRTSPRATSTRWARSTRTSAPGGSAAGSTGSGSAENPLQGLSLDGRLAPTLATSRVPVAAVSGPRSTASGRETCGGRSRSGCSRRSARWARPMPAPATWRSPRRARPPSSPRGCASSSRRSRDEGGSIVAPVAYPEGDDDFPRHLKDLAGLLAAGLPIRAVALSGAGEYDTHDNQPEDFASGLKLTADALLAFQRDLEARGLANRVVVHVWSEFGRRPEENGSLGTDHGAAGVGFLLGSRVKGGLIGEFPGLASSTRSGTCARPATSARSSPRCSSSGSAPTPGRSSRARRASSDRKSSASRAGAATVAPMTDKPLTGKVALVAGATRGAGRGTAVALGEAGATVYCTGRTTKERRSEYDRPETIEETADLVTEAGGTGIAVAVDHLEPEQVAALVQRIDADSGRLDLLVNDIWGGERLFEWDTPVWEHDLENGLRMLRLAIDTHLITSHSRFRS